MRNKKIRKKLYGAKYKIAIAKANFNGEITSGLLAGCLRALKECAVSDKNIKILEVPGSFELPLAAQKLAAANPHGGRVKKYDAVICLGAVIKGETKHDEYISSACSMGLVNVALKFNLPVLFAVLTTPNLELAKARAGDDDFNKGYEAGLAAVEILDNLAKI
ncbi:6,7-dimethyl-8-ribityllumazine synthase [Patescibacteria group bacterium]|nr:MAG: 6,7-dimethyl-8-ribityllumazine synthase [Patescibacteria group bacterium]